VHDLSCRIIFPTLSSPPHIIRHTPVERHQIHIRQALDVCKIAEVACGGLITDVSPNLMIDLIADTNGGASSRSLVYPVGKVIYTTLRVGDIIQFQIAP